MTLDSGDGELSGALLGADPRPFAEVTMLGCRSVVHRERPHGDAAAWYAQLAGAE